MRASLLSLVAFGSGLGATWLVACHSATPPAEGAPVETSTSSAPTPETPSAEEAPSPPPSPLKEPGLACGHERCGEGTDFPKAVCCAPEGRYLDYYLCVPAFDCMTAGEDGPAYDALCTSSADCDEGQVCQAVMNKLIPIPQFRCTAPSAELVGGPNMRLCKEDQECVSACPDNLTPTCSGRFKNLKACQCADAKGLASSGKCHEESRGDPCALSDGSEGFCDGLECLSLSACRKSAPPFTEDGKGTCAEVEGMECGQNRECLEQRQAMKQECLQDTQGPAAGWLASTCHDYRPLYELSRP